MALTIPAAVDSAPLVSRSRSPPLRPSRQPTTMSLPKQDRQAIRSMRSTPKTCSASSRERTWARGRPVARIRDHWILRRGTGLDRLNEQQFSFENALTDSFGLELGAHVLGQDIRRASELPDFVGINFMGVSAEFRYVVRHRTADVPIQVTLTVQPEYNSIAEAGRQANDFGTTFRAIADVISSDQRLYGAINLVYAPDASRLPGQLREDTAVLSTSAALSYRLTPPLMFGTEADYDRAYGGLAPRAFEGQAFYLGPTFHYQINEKINLSAAFLAQTPVGRVDFDEFPRQLAKLRLEVDF